MQGKAVYTDVEGLQRTKFILCYVNSFISRQAESNIGRFQPASRNLLDDQAIRVHHVHTASAENRHKQSSILAESHTIRSLITGNGVRIALAKALPRTEIPIFPPQVAVDHPSPGLVDVEVAVGPESKPVREAQPAIQLLDLPRFGVNAVNPAIEFYAFVIGSRPRANLIVSYRDAGIRQIHGAIRTEAEIVRPQEWFTFTLGCDDLRRAIHGHPEQGRIR